MRLLYMTGFILFLLPGRYGCLFQDKQVKEISKISRTIAVIDTIILPRQNDTSLYHTKMLELANGDKSGRWPPKTISPAAGAILPYNRVVAYYGNFYSANMGVLGQYPQAILLEKLKAEIRKWEMADSLTPVIPAIHYIAVTAQHSPGSAKKYRLRMPNQQIDKAIELAAKVNGIVFLDIQVGMSTLEEEIPALKKYLQMPQVHLGIDPEFSMKSGNIPGTTIGTFDAADVNYAAGYLAALVNQYGLPPKILVVHRFTNGMLTNYKHIQTRKEVQLVIDMDGWGFPAKKKNTYNQCIYKEPVQFAGIKLFYKNDIKEVKQIMTAAEVLKLKPKPIYIQYQ